jgi:hypothetical protein
MKRRLYTLIVAGAALGLAAAIYLGARRGMRIHTWADAWAPSLVRLLRGASGTLPMPGWVRYSLPDALWQLAFCLVMLVIWQDAPRSRRRLFFCVFPAAAGALIEIGQGLGVVQGVFDPMDLFLSLLAAAVAFALVPRTVAT